MTLKSLTTIEPTHVGEVLKEEFMVPHNLSANALGSHLGVPANRISQLVKGSRGMTADTAIRLSKAFGTTAEFWMNLQNHYEIELAKDRLATTPEREIEEYPELAYG